MVPVEIPPLKLALTASKGSLAQGARGTDFFRISTEN